MTDLKDAPTTGGRLAFAVICAATLMTIVDETIVTVAAPSIQSDLSFSDKGLSWVVNAYLVGFGGLLLLAGRVGDLIGRDRVLMTGMSVFTAASIACGVAVSPAWLITARFVQGAGGALATAVALGMIAALTPDERSRARAMGTYAFMGAVGASSGLALGGVITSALGWRWAFFVNVPIGIAVVLTGRRALPRERTPGLGRDVDWAGALLLVAGLTVVVAAVVTTGLLAATVGVALLLAFVVRQALVSRPVLPLAVFRSRILVGANLAHALFVGAMFTFQFLVTLYLQRVLGFSAVQAGLGIVPIAAGIAFFSMVVYSRVTARVGTRPVLLSGLALVAAGLALLGRASADGSYWSDVLPSVLLFAVGGGLTLPAMMTTAMSVATPQTMGVTSGLLNTSQQVGGALGLAALSAVAAATTSSSLADGATGSVALVDGYRLAWTLAAGLVALAFVVTATLLRPPKPRIAV